LIVDKVMTPVDNQGYDVFCFHVYII